MATDFSRTLSLLRQEKGVSQRKAAGELGISQALLSHYENGIREPGLAFVVKACAYYHVSADFLLGRTLNRDGSIIEAEDVYDSSGEKGSLRGSILATLQKKLVVNTTGALFELLGKTGDREAITAAGDYLGDALYQLLRQLYRQGGGNEDLFAAALFSLSWRMSSSVAMRTTCLSGVVSFVSSISRTSVTTSPNSMPRVVSTITKSPGVGQSAAQVFHSVDERCKSYQH